MEKPILYILLHNELASMTAGRAAAQASHITSVFTADASMEASDKIRDQFNVWESESSTNCFGTAIVLGANEEQILNIVGDAFAHEFMSGSVNDDTYAVRDGDYTHYVDLLVGGYVFMHKDFTYSLKEKMDELELF